MAKAAILEQVGGLTIGEVELADPAPHEVLIDTKACGLCHSDLHFIDGAYPHPLPAIPGHEAAGVVRAVGSEVKTVKPGDHVVSCLSAFCGHCEFCVTGRMALCLGGDTRRAQTAAPRITRNGGEPVAQMLNLSAFADQMLIHEHACVAIDKDMPFDRAAVLGCAVTTGAGTIFNAIKLTPGESVAVIGCGGIGLCAINAAALAGAGRIIAMDRIAEKEDLARRFGATDFIDASDGQAVPRIIEMTRGGVDHAIEAIGLAKTAQDAFTMLRRGGTATIVGMIPVGQKVSLNGYEFLAEKSLKGSNMGSNRFPVDIPRLVDFYMAGRLRLDELISRRIGLHQIEEAFAEMKGGNIARSVITFA